MATLKKGFRFSVTKTSETLYPSLSKSQHIANNEWFNRVWNMLNDGGLSTSPNKSYQTIRKVEQTNEWEIV